MMQIRKEIRGLKSEERKEVRREKDLRREKIGMMQMRKEIRGVRLKDRKEVRRGRLNIRGLKKFIW